MVLNTKKKNESTKKKKKNDYLTKIYFGPLLILLSIVSSYC